MKLTGVSTKWDTLDGDHVFLRFLRYEMICRLFINSIVETEMLSGLVRYKYIKTHIHLHYLHMAVY